MVRRVLFVLVFLLAQGCGGNFIVRVSGIKGHQITERNYIIAPGNTGTSSNDLQFQEYSRYLDKVLQDRGWSPARIASEADIVVFLAYGIGDPRQHTYSYSVYGKTGTSRTKGGKTVTHKGYRTQVSTYDTYSRYFTLKAADYRHHQKTKELKFVWETTVTSTGTSGDLRRVMPVMMAAATHYVGTNTGEKVRVDISETNKKVRAMKELTK